MAELMGAFFAAFLCEHAKILILRYFELAPKTCTVTCALL
jgi:hypothetical protein